MRNLIVLLFFSLILLSPALHAQEFYVQKQNLSGIIGHYDILLNDKASEISELIPTGTNNTFKIYSYDLYPMLTFIEQDCGYDQSIAFVQDEIKNLPHHFTIIKKFEVSKEDDSYIAKTDHIYDVRFKLPDVAPFNTFNFLDLSTIEQLVENTIKSEWDKYHNNVLAEKKGLELFIDLIQKLINDEDIQGDFGILDFVEIPLAPQVEFTITQGDKYQSASKKSSSLVNEYAHIKIAEGDNMEDLLEFLPGTNGNPIPIVEDYDIQPIYFFSSNEFAPQGSTFEEEINSLTIDPASVSFVFWVHISEGTGDQLQDQCFVYSKSFIPEDIMELIVDQSFVNEAIAWELDLGSNVYGLQSASSSSKNKSDLIPYGKNHILPVVEDKVTSLLGFPPSHEDYDSIIFGAALACGFLDGFIASIKSIYDLGKGVAEAGSGFLTKTKNYFVDCFTLAVKERSLFSVFKKVASDQIELYKTIFKEIKKVYDLVKELTYDKVKEMFHSIYQGLKDWFVSFVNLDKVAGYQTGKIAFDVFFTILTAGSGSAVLGAKYAGNFMKVFKGHSSKIRGFVKKQMTLAENTTPATKKAHKCKIIGKGCFVKDTPVLMAGNRTIKTVKLGEDPQETFEKNIHRKKIFNLKQSAKSLAVAAAIPIVAVPIQDVQLLEYAVSHETVNSTYGLAASVGDDIYSGLLDKDPYTSDQQRERDEYEINDVDWNEVFFEDERLFHKESSDTKSLDKEGTANNWISAGIRYSSFKLALHSDWIAKKNYCLGAVVNMNLPEQGISGPFRITSIKHILPQKKPSNNDDSESNLGEEYVYRPVTALFSHVSDQVYNIAFDSGEELGVTYQHPIYSVTNGDWRLAGDLEVGEKVLTKFGDATVISSTKKEGSETVYNLEVKEFHNYLVGESGIVVHNYYIKPLKPLLQNMSEVFNNWIGPFKSITRQATTDFYQYQQRILGTLVEKRIPLKKPHDFSRDNLDIDGFEPSTGSLIDTKFVRNPSNSPYTGGSTFPPILDEMLDELKRYKHIIDDIDSPARDLKIITNNADAKVYLENIMNSLDIPGGVILIK